MQKNVHNDNPKEIKFVKVVVYENINQTRATHFI